jgi:isopenicillin N synthase-like dioxygenase
MRLHLQVLQAVACGLVIEEGWFDGRCGKGDNTLRLLHYPPVRREVFEGNKVSELFDLVFDECCIGGLLKNAFIVVLSVDEDQAPVAVPLLVDHEANLIMHQDSDQLTCVALLQNTVRAGAHTDYGSMTLLFQVSCFHFQSHGQRQHFNNHPSRPTNIKPATLSVR